MAPLNRLPSAHSLPKLAFGVLLILYALSSPSMAGDAKTASGAGDATLIRVNFISETSGPKDTVEINGKIIPDYRPRIIRLFPATGVVFDSQGHILTFLGYRWVDIQSQKARIELVTSEGQRLKGKLVGIDQSMGVAVVAALEGKLPKTPICSSCRIQNGATVAVPVEEDVQLSQFRRAQVLSVDSAIEAANQGEWVVRISRPGPDVGAPILSAENYVLGFVAGKSAPGERTIVYPISQLLNSAQKVLKAGGDISTGWLGVFIENEWSNSSPGIAIKQVLDDSPAQKAGLQPRDVILKFDGKDVVDPRRFIQIVQNTSLGSTVDLEIQRQGERINLAARIEPRKPQETPASLAFNFPGMISFPDSENRSKDASGNYGPLIGIETVVMTPSLADFLQMPRQNGLLVLKVESTLPAGGAGMMPGDLIISADGVPTPDAYSLYAHPRS
jgi:S1-C subfamily serine protease